MRYLLPGFFTVGRALLLAVQPRSANKLFESWSLYRNLRSFMSWAPSVALPVPWSFPDASPPGPLETFLAYRGTGLWNSSPTRTSPWYLCCYENSSTSTKLGKQESLRKPTWVGYVEVKRISGGAHDTLKDKGREEASLGRKILPHFKSQSKVMIPSC